MPPFTGASAPAGREAARTAASEGREPHLQTNQVSAMVPPVTDHPHSPTILSRKGDAPVNRRKCAGDSSTQPRSAPWQFARNSSNRTDLRWNSVNCHSLKQGPSLTSRADRGAVYSQKGSLVKRTGFAVRVFVSGGDSLKLITFEVVSHLV